MICISPQQTWNFWNEAITIFLISGSKPTARNSLFCCFHLKTGRGLIHELCINFLWLETTVKSDPRCWYLPTCFIHVYTWFTFVSELENERTWPASLWLNPYLWHRFEHAIKVDQARLLHNYCRWKNTMTRLIIELNPKLHAINMKV